MNKYIATFYSHFGAISFSRYCESNNIQAKMMPVPRKLSSSCGTCVEYISDNPMYDSIDSDNVERIVEVKNDNYIDIYPIKES